MESQNQKWVNTTFLAFSILIGYVLFAAATKLAGVYDLEARVRSIELIIRLSSIGIVVLMFVGLIRSDRANQFMHEVVTELTRVTWPTGKETVNATIITLAMVLITGLVLGLFDKFWTLVIQWIL